MSIPSNTNPPNTGPSVSSQAAGTVRDTQQALRDLLRSGEDFNDIIKDQVRELGKLLSNYDKVRKSIDGYRSSSLDVKKIQNDIESTLSKQVVQQAKVNELEKKMSETSPAQLHNANQLLGLIQSRNTLTGQALDLLDEQIDAEMKLLTPLEAEYVARQKSLDLLKATNNDLDIQLEKEKKVRSGIGLSGAAFSIFSKKLGLGTEVYEKMVAKARELQDANGKISKTAVFGAGLKAAAGGLFENLKDPMMYIPLIGGAISGLVSGLKSAFDYIVGIQDKTIKFARTMNMSTEEARKLKMQYADINVANGDLFVNTEKLVQAQSEMVGLLGVTNQLSTQNLATNIKLKDIAGVEADTIASITESSIINGKTNESIVKSVFAQVKGLKQATGIQFENKQILKEASSLGGVLGLQFAKYPAQLTKSLLTVKAMGMELKQLDAMADSFLDFESSISKEFEAQLLTGKEINLAKAREMFLNNDLAGAAAEINKQVGSTADFLKMNRIQQDAFAGAMGMSRDQMGDMLKKQEMLSKLGAKDTDNSREQLRLGLAKYKNQKALSEAIGEENYQNLVNASLQEKIGAFMEKIKQSISDFVEKSGIIGKIEGMMNWLSQPQNIRTVLMTVRDVFATIVDVVASVASGIISAMDFFGVISEQKSAELKGFLDGAGDRVRSMGGDLSMAAAKEKSGVGSSNNTTGNQQSSSTLMGQSINVTSIVQIEKETVGKAVKQVVPTMPNYDNNRTGKTAK